MNPGTLWAKTLKSIYFTSNKNFLEAKYKTNSLWLWKSLMKGKYLLKKGICWKLWNEEKIDF